MVEVSWSVRLWTFLMCDAIKGWVFYIFLESNEKQEVLLVSRSYAGKSTFEKVLWRLRLNMSLLFLLHQISTQVHSKESNLQKLNQESMFEFIFDLFSFFFSKCCSFLGQLAPYGCGRKKGISSLLIRKAAEEGFMPLSEPESAFWCFTRSSLKSTPKYVHVFQTSSKISKLSCMLLNNESGFTSWVLSSIRFLQGRCFPRMFSK